MADTPLTPALREQQRLRAVANADRAWKMVSEFRKQVDVLWAALDTIAAGTDDPVLTAIDAVQEFKKLRG